MGRFDYDTETVIHAVRDLYGAMHRRFIESHVRNLLNIGPTFILKAHRTKIRTISEHLLKLYDAQLEAEHNPSLYSLGLVRYYVRELDRLNAELRIFEDAMQIANIPFR